MLDGKEISDTEKQFLLKWKEAKETKKRQKQEGELMNGQPNGSKCIALYVL